MKCQICDHRPRQFVLFGGNYWHRIGDEHWICYPCYYWAKNILGPVNV